MPADVHEARAARRPSRARQRPGRGRSAREEASPAPRPTRPGPRTATHARRCGRARARATSGVRVPARRERPAVLERVLERRDRAAYRCECCVAGLLLTVLVSQDTLGSARIEQAAPSPRGSDRVDDILRAACRVVVTEGASDLRIGTRRAGGRAFRGRSSTTTSRRGRSSCARRSPTRRTSVSRRSRPSSATLATGAERAERALVRTIDPELEETPALWNEVWSSLRYDEELRPLVQERYRAWIERIVRLLEEGRADGSVPRSVDPARAGLAPRGRGRRARLDPATSACSIVTPPGCCSPRASSRSSTA